MLQTLKAILDLFRKGKEVSNPEAWKYGQITVGAISALLVSILGLAKLKGYDLGLTTDQINNIALIIVTINGLFHPIATVISTTKVGLPAKDKASGGTPTRSTANFPGFPK